MAMNEIQIGRLQHLLERLLSLKGEISAQQLSPEVIPTLPLEVDRPEWKALANERLCWGTGTQTAVGGENSHVQLLNPAQSSAIMVLEQMIVCPVATGQTRIGHQDVKMSGGGVAQTASGFRDSRLNRGSTVSSGQVITGTNPGLLITSQLMNLDEQGNVHPLQIELPLILTPNTGLGVARVTVNESITVSFLWRERKLEPQEQNLGA